MLKINSIDFFPIKGDEDFKIVLRPLSFVAFQEIKMVIAKDEPSGGPDMKTNYQKAESHLEFVRKIFEKTVVKIEGCKVDGVELDNKEKFLEYAPAHVVNAVISKIMEMISPSEPEIKN